MAVRARAETSFPSHYARKPTKSDWKALDTSAIEPIESARFHELAFRSFEDAPRTSQGFTNISSVLSRALAQWLS